MTVEQHYNSALKFQSKMYWAIFGTAVMASGWLFGEILSSSSPERIDGLAWFFKNAIITSIFALSGVAIVYLFRSAGSGMNNEYNDYFLRKARQKPWLMSLSKKIEILLPIFQVLVTLAPFVYVMIILISFFSNMTEIIEWIKETVM